MSAQRSAASDENWASAASSLHSHAGFSAERTNSVGVFAATATVKHTAMRMEDEARSGRCAQYAKVTRTQTTRVVMSNATTALGAMGGEQAGGGICEEEAEEEARRPTPKLRTAAPRGTRGAQRRSAQGGADAKFG